MRILLSCLQSLRSHAVPAYAFWENYFKRGIEEAGHEWVQVPGVDWAEALALRVPGELAAWRERTWSRTVEFVRQDQARQRPHLFLGYLYPHMVEASAVREVQALGVPCVNFFCDNVREFHRVPKEYAVFDLHWVPEQQALAMYRQEGLKCVHAAMPCWVPTELRSVPAREAEPPTFIGSADLLRRDLLGRAVQAGGDFMVRGPGWQPHDHDRDREPAAPSAAGSPWQLIKNQWDMVRAQGLTALVCKVQNRLWPVPNTPFPPARLQPPVFGTEYFRVSREAEVTIGVNRVPTARRSNHHPLTYSRLRDLEAPMLGACYLTEWTEGLAEMYELGAEIETYRTADELAAKLQELRQDGPRRQTMRQKAQRRALADHCVARSLERIGKQMGLSV